MTDIFAKIKLSRHQWQWMAATMMLLVFFIFMLIYLSNKQENLQKQISANQIALPWMYQVSAKIKSNRNRPANTRKANMTLASRVSLETKKYGLKSAKLKSSGSNQVILNFTKVNFVKLHNLIFNLEHQRNIEIIKADIKKERDKTGAVSGSLVLAR